MKKYIFISIVALAAILITFSCKKSIETPTEPAHLSYRTSNAETKVMNFLSPNNNLKDEKLYSADSAVWYSEAALNFTYAIFDSSYVYMLSDSNEFSFDLDQNNQVTQTELEEVFGDMEDVLDEFHDGIQDNIKHVFLCDVEEISISGGKLNVVMISRIACGYRGFYHYGTGIMHELQCLPPSELEFYMTSNGIPYIIDDNVPSNPTNMEYEYIYISSWGLMSGLNYWVEDHIMDITYGVKHQTTIPASGL